MRDSNQVFFFFNEVGCGEEPILAHKNKFVLLTSTQRLTQHRISFLVVGFILFIYFGFDSVGLCVRLCTVQFNKVVFSISWKCYMKNKGFIKFTAKRE